MPFSFWQVKEKAPIMLNLYLVNSRYNCNCLGSLCLMSSFFKLNSCFSGLRDSLDIPGSRAAALVMYNMGQNFKSVPLFFLQKGTMSNYVPILLGSLKERGPISHAFLAIHVYYTKITAICLVFMPQNQVCQVFLCNKAFPIFS